MLLNSCPSLLTLYFFNHLQFSWSIAPIFSLPGQKSRRRRQKGPGLNLPIFLLLGFRKETRGERDSSATRRRSPHWGKGDYRLFWRGECFFARAWNHLAIRKVPWYGGTCPVVEDPFKPGT